MTQTLFSCVYFIWLLQIKYQWTKEAFMTIIKIQNLTFSYPGTYENIFENLQLTLDSDWKLGFTGRNGRGKTTFLKLLMGNLDYKGLISTKVIFDYFPFDVEETKEYTYEIIDKIVAAYEHWELVKEMNLLGLEEQCLYRPYNTLSQGEQTKMQMIMLFLKHNRFLLIDEPTNHLDIPGRQLMKNYLNSKKGFIVVSHDREFLDGCTDHTLSINKTKIEIEQGSYSSYLQNKNYKDQNELSQNEKLKKQIFSLAVAAKRAEGWSDALEATKIGNGPVDRGFIGAKSAKMMKRSKNIQRRKERAIEDKSRLLKDIEQAEALEMKPEIFRTNQLINVSELSIKYNENLVVKDISFKVNVGDRVAIRGANGSGKSSIIKAIMKTLDFEGHIYMPSDLVISYVSQDTSHLNGSITEYIDQCDVEDWLFRSMLHKLDFDEEMYQKNLEQLSEGQKKKILLGKSLCQRAHIYIWDEPLNYIDIHSKEQIEHAILTYCPTMIFVEHDGYFNKTIATKTIEL